MERIRRNWGKSELSFFKRKCDVPSGYELVCLMILKTSLEMMAISDSACW